MKHAHDQGLFVVLVSLPLTHLSTKTHFATCFPDVNPFTSIYGLV